MHVETYLHTDDIAWFIKRTFLKFFSDSGQNQRTTGRQEVENQFKVLF